MAGKAPDISERDRKQELGAESSEKTSGGPEKVPQDTEARDSRAGEPREGAGAKREGGHGDTDVTDGARDSAPAAGEKDGKEPRLAGAAETRESGGTPAKEPREEEREEAEPEEARERKPGRARPGVPDPRSAGADSRASGSAREPEGGPRDTEDPQAKEEPAGTGPSALEPAATSVKTPDEPGREPAKEPEDGPGTAGSTGKAGAAGTAASDAAPVRDEEAASRQEASPEPGDKPESGDKPEAEEGEDGAPTAAKAVDQPTTALKPPSSGTRSGKDGPKGGPVDDPGDAAVDEGRPSAARAVDQPTTALKLPRSATDDARKDGGSTAVDQPTTALKIPREPAGQSEDVAATSKFVALKTDEEIAAARGPAAPAPARTGPAEPAEQAEAATERAPLDLLAELTNKPAPPPTPLRIFLRRVKIWTPLVVLLMIVFVVAQLLRPLPAPELELTAAGTYTFEGEAPQVPWPAGGQAALEVSGLGSFGTFGEQEPVPIASVAKTMTAYIILRDHPVLDGEDGVEIPVDQLAEDEAALSDVGESTVEVRAGDTISQREAIQAIMIASGNNIARLLARWDAGSEEEFVEKMNATAAELGMKNTTYTDPSGLSAETVSTAEDQVLLAREAMKDPLFRQVVRMPSYEDSRGRQHGNWNHLVPLNGVVGIKTGTTTAAGGNLLFAAEREVEGTTQLIIGAVLSQPPHPSDNSILTGALTASDQLIRFAQEQLLTAGVLSAGQVVGHVDDGLGGRTPVVLTEDVEAVGWPGLEVRLRLTEGGEEIPGRADSGTEVGSLTVGSGAGRVEVPVVLGEALTEPGFGARVARVG